MSKLVATEFDGATTSNGAHPVLLVLDNDDLVRHLMSFCTRKDIKDIKDALRLVSHAVRSYVDARVHGVSWPHSVWPPTALIMGLRRFPNLEKLRLGGELLGAGSPKIYGESHIPQCVASHLVVGAALMQSLEDGTAPCPQLKVLDLEGSGMLHGPVRVILQSACCFPMLKVLTLSGCCVQDEGASDLAAADLAELKELRLNGSRVGDKGVKAIACAYAKRLKVLQLGEGGRRKTITQRGAAALAGAGTWPHLVHLDFSGQDLKVQGAEALASLQAPHLEHLDLRGSGFDDRAVVALLTSGSGCASSFPNLARLLLSDNVEEAGATALAQASLPKLASINVGLTFSTLDSSVATAAALSRGQWPLLREMVVRFKFSYGSVAHDQRQQVSAAAAAALLAGGSPQWLRMLEHLHIGGVIDVQAAAALAAAHLPCLRELSFVGVYGGVDDTLAALAQAHLPSLVSLRLLPSDNQNYLCSEPLTPTSVSALCSAAWAPQLRDLQVRGRSLDREGSAALLQALPAFTALEAVELVSTCVSMDALSQVVLPRVQVVKVWCYIAQDAVLLLQAAAEGRMPLLRELHVTGMANNEEREELEQDAAMFAAGVRVVFFVW